MAEKNETDVAPLKIIQVGWVDNASAYFPFLAMGWIFEAPDGKRIEPCGLDYHHPLQWESTPRGETYFGYTYKELYEIQRRRSEFAGGV